MQGSTYSSTAGSQGKRDHSHQGQASREPAPVGKAPDMELEDLASANPAPSRRSHWLWLTTPNRDAHELADSSAAASRACASSTPSPPPRSRGGLPSHSFPPWCICSVVIGSRSSSLRLRYPVWTPCCCCVPHSSLLPSRQLVSAIKHDAVFNP